MGFSASRRQICRKSCRHFWTNPRKNFWRNAWNNFPEVISEDIHSAKFKGIHRNSWKNCPRKLLRFFYESLEELLKRTLVFFKKSLAKVLKDFGTYDILKEIAGEFAERRNSWSNWWANSWKSEGISVPVHAWFYKKITGELAEAIRVRFSENIRWRIFKRIHGTIPDGIHGRIFKSVPSFLFCF